MPGPKKKPQKKRSFKSAQEGLRRRSGTAVEQVQRFDEELTRRKAQRSLQSGKRPPRSMIPRGPQGTIPKKGRNI